MDLKKSKCHIGMQALLRHKRRTTMVTALISMLGVLILGSVTASFILALIKLDEIDEIS